MGNLRNREVVGAQERNRDFEIAAALAAETGEDL
jgi:hypothetical protein